LEKLACHLSKALLKLRPTHSRVMRDCSARQGKHTFLAAVRSILPTAVLTQTCAALNGDAHVLVCKMTCRCLFREVLHWGVRIGGPRTQLLGAACAHTALRELPCTCSLRQLQQAPCCVSAGSQVRCGRFGKQPNSTGTSCCCACADEEATKHTGTGLSLFCTALADCPCMALAAHARLCCGCCAASDGTVVANWRRHQGVRAHRVAHQGADSAVRHCHEPQRSDTTGPLVRPCLMLTRFAHPQLLVRGRRATPSPSLTGYARCRATRRPWRSPAAMPAPCAACATRPAQWCRRAARALLRPLLALSRTLLLQQHQARAGAAGGGLL